ncbi:MAG: hypothetical protein FWC41_11885 [Firmicutes bacterium]|nr:hypothetical protein [Bacillota bacterium]
MYRIRFSIGREGRITRILVDTNVLIYREENREIPEDLQNLLKTLYALKSEILVHPKSIEEIQNDKNSDRQKIQSSKVETYVKLESPPNPLEDTDFLEKMKNSNIHDEVDNYLLYAVYRNAVNFLITEDKEIQRKAAQLNLRDRVLSCREAADSFKYILPREKIESPPALREDFVYTLDLNDAFFDTLKQEYRGFEEWFAKISREGRKCYVHYQGKRISALLIRKVENETILSTPSLPAKKRLKLCLFKVERPGNRIGELFIKLAVKYCIENEIDEIYLTHYTKEEDYLSKLLFDYGFYIASKKTNGEEVYLKKLMTDSEISKNLSPSEIGCKYYPTFYDGVMVKKFIVPIVPQFHDRLFTDYKRRQSILSEFGGEFIVEGNTISKVYLSHSKIGNMSKGDLLLFYRSHDLKAVTTLGVLEEVTRIKDPKKIVEKVRNRTVYSYDEIMDLAKKPVLVLLFRWHFYLPQPLNLNKLTEVGILKGAPQTITKIEHQNYLKLRKESQLDERYTVN